MPISNTSPRLSEKCVSMKVCGVSIIGQPETGAFIGLDEEGEALVQTLNEGIQIKPNELTENQRLLLKVLAENGYFAQEAKLVKLRSADIHVTSHCNLNCAGCYSFEEGRNSRHDLSTEDIKKILNNLASSGITTLTILGGEPFVRDDIVEIMMYAKKP